MHNVSAATKWEICWQPPSPPHGTKYAIPDKCMVIIYSKSMAQPGKVANPARGQLNREIYSSLSPFAPEIWSRETGSAVPFRVSQLMSTLRLNLVLIYGIPPDFRVISTNFTR